MKKLAITSMYANPLHPWHIECLNLSKNLVDELWVIVNNDIQAEMKRGIKSFQDEKFRIKIVESLKAVDRVFLSIDTTPSVCESLEFLIKEAKESWEYNSIIFTKWWDRFASEIPESKICEFYWVKIVDGLWLKTHNSSDFIAKIKNKNDEKELRKSLELIPDSHKEKEYLEIGYRPWWVYYVLEDNPHYKVKKIIVEPKKRLSLQSHEKRSEHWTIVTWVATVDIRNPEFKDIEQKRILKSNESCFIPQWHIHRIENNFDDILIIIEIQCWEYTGEDDITRYEDDFWRIQN